MKSHYPYRVAHVTTVHSSDDSRIYSRYVQSLKSRFTLFYIAPVSKREIQQDGFQFIPIQTYPDRIKRAVLTGFSAFFKVLKQSVDIIHFHDPEWLPFAAILILLGKKVVYDVHENTLGDLSHRNLSTFQEKLFARVYTLLCRFVSNHGAMVYVYELTQPIPDYLKADRSIYMYNYAPEVEWKKHREIKRKMNHEIQLVYFGLISDFYYEIQPVLKAMLRLKEMHFSVRLLCAGKFGKSIFSSIESYPEFTFLQNEIMFMGDQSWDKIAPLTRMSHIGICLKNQGDSSVWSVERKFYEYTMIGLPVICCNTMLYREKLAESNSGIGVDLTNSDSIAQAIISMIQDPNQYEKMQQNAARISDEKWSWEKQMIFLEKWYLEWLNL